MPPTKIINVHTHIHPHQDIDERVKITSATQRVLRISVAGPEEEFSYPFDRTPFGLG